LRQHTLQRGDPRIASCTKVRLRRSVEQAPAALSRSSHQIDPYALAEPHGISAYTLDGLRGFGTGTEAINHFTAWDSSTRSAALVPLGTAPVIIENESHATARRPSNIPHELGHHLLEHPFDDVSFGKDHKRQLNEHSTFVLLR
jgi:IrrE N-terminal-like domain